MNLKDKFVSFVLVVDTFFVAYAVGFNSHHVLVVDPSLPPVAVTKSEPTKPPASDSSASKSTAKTMSTSQTSAHPSAPASSGEHAAEQKTSARTHTAKHAHSKKHKHD